MILVWKCALPSQDWDRPVCGKDATIWYQAHGGPVLGVCDSCSTPFLKRDYMDMAAVIVWNRDEVLALEVMSS